MHVRTIRRSSFVLVSSLFVIPLLWLSLGAAGAHAAASSVPAAGVSQVLVEVAKGVSRDEAGAIASSLEATLVDEIDRWGVSDGSHLYVLRSRARSGEDLAAALKQVEGVQRVSVDVSFEPEATYPNDFYLLDNWGLRRAAAPSAWDTQTGSAGVVVAVLDSGIDYTHPDLVNNMWHNPGEIAGDGIDNDGNGYVDDVYGIDVYANDGDPMDGQAHGTWVAGIIGAQGNNGIGAVGVNWTTRLMAVRCLGWNGTALVGTAAGALEGAYYIIDQRVNHGVNVVAINTSWGQGNVPYDPFMQDAIRAAGTAGIVWTASAGNEGFNTDAIAHYPSGYNASNILSVAASNEDEVLPSWSNWGPTTVDLAAPGSGIYSTEPGPTYAGNSGTSPASAMTAGAVALMAAQYPAETALQRVDRIMSGVDVFPVYAGKMVTGGRLNIYRSLNADLRPVSQIAGIDDAWHTTPVTATFSASDGTGIGVDHTEYSLDSGAYTAGASATVSSDGNHTLDYRAVDKAGNVETAKQVRVKVDQTAPSITAPGLTGVWRTSPTTVRLTASDPASGVATFEYRLSTDPEWTLVGATSVDVQLSGEGSIELQGRASDVAGNASAVKSFYVKLDGTAPTVAVVGVDGNWHGSDQTVTLNASDPNAPDSSGVANIEYREGDSAAWTKVSGSSTQLTVPAAGNDGIHTYQYRATDAAGNVSDVSTFAVKIDTTPPTSSVQGGGETWHNGTATGVITAQDVAGVDRIAYHIVGDSAWTVIVGSRASFDVSGDGVHEYEYNVVDVLGHVSETRAFQVRIDTLAPTVSTTGADDVWHATDVTVSLSATDPGEPAASGVAGIEYRRGKSGAWIYQAGGSADVVVLAAENEGSTLYQYRAMDAAGNTSRIATFTVKIDTVAPVSSAQGGGSTWRKAPVTLMFTASDTGSGVDHIEYSLDGETWTTAAKLKIGDEGTTSVKYRAVDAVGNVEKVRSTNVNIDTHGPQTKALRSFSVKRGKTATFRYSVLEPNPTGVAMSPIAKVKLVITLKGKVKKTLTLPARASNGILRYRWTCKLNRGKYKWSIQATDKAGNSQSKRTWKNLTVK